MDIARWWMFFWAYLRRPPWESGLTPPELLAFLEGRAAGRALDLGCGTGTNAITLASRGWQVTGVDFIPSAIWQARRKARRAGVQVRFLVADVTRLEHLSSGFDLLLDIGCFHSLSARDRLRYLREADRLLTPGGVWFLYGFLTEFSPPGIFPSDLDAIRGLFRLLSYQEGFDRNGRASAYFTLQKT
ncbi:MAG: class I SAM-dependent methyltransferase [Anaerolineales bacterium]|nr:class I SAM-dependent methyltransferase [Anaerolineales bacterium]MDW8277125.1 class I SAM-dependent methyltransferase [Anaerolineales bacterium]